MDKTKCIEYRGVRDVVCAEVITDTADKFEVGTPFSMIWASEISKDTTTSTDTHYYDNMPAIVITSTGSDTTKKQACLLKVSERIRITPLAISQRIQAVRRDMSGGSREALVFHLQLIRLRTMEQKPMDRR